MTFHPVTLEPKTADSQMIELLEALNDLQDTTIIFTMPNADIESRTLIKMVADFVQSRENSYAFESLGQLRYLSCLQFVDGVVGNSSSGILEVPTFRKGTINIGNRQNGRLKAESVIECDPAKVSILNAIQIMYSRDFQEQIKSVSNPYGVGGASKSIVTVLESISLDGVIQKSFVNLISL